MCSPSASSMVSQAARVGAMTMIRPVGGSAATNASWSGGRYLSITCLCIACWKVHRSHRMRNGPGKISGAARFASGYLLFLFLFLSLFLSLYLLFVLLLL